MSVRARLARWFDLGPRDDPRVIAVAGKASRPSLSIASTPGARLRVERTGESGEVGRLLSWAFERGVPVEVTTGTSDTVWVDGRVVLPGGARAALARGGTGFTVRRRGG